MQITHKKGEMCKNRLIIKECPYLVPPKISIVIKKPPRGGMSRRKASLSVIGKSFLQK